MNELVKKVRETVKRYQLLHPGDRVLVALSGGADSVCLLWVLRALQSEWNLSLFAAHVHHGLRGKEADADERFVRNLCKEMDIPCYVKHADVKGIAKAKGMGLEEAGREVRYTFFNEVFVKEGLHKIATAHHAGDNAETVLMRLIRGTGPLGLGGIPVQNGVIIRPLLQVLKKEIEAYLTELNIPWQTDETNTDTVFTRNRVRHRLIPLLENEFNPGFQKNFAEQIELYASWGSYIKEEATKIFATLTVPVAGGYGFECRLLQAQPSFLRQMLLYETISYLSVDREIGRVAVLSAEKLMEKESGKADLGGNVTAQMCHGVLYIRKNLPVRAFNYEVKPEGHFFVPEIGQSICFSLLSGLPEEKHSHIAYLDWSALQNKKLVVRSRREGDYFYPSGMGGRQKLKDYFIDKKVPAFLRDEVPIITADDNIVWVAGYRVDERYAARDDAKSVLCLTLEKIREIFN